MSASRAFAAICFASLAAIGAALVSQHVFGMEPCPWCVLQRVIFLGVAVVSGLALVVRSGAVRRVCAALGVALAGCGIAAALWQHFRAAASASCNLTLADRIVSGLGLVRAAPDVFEPRASCADAAVTLLGVPYDFWSLALFVPLAAASGWLLLRQSGRARR